MQILVTVSRENSKKLEVLRIDKVLHQSTQFSMVIPNMIILLHKSSILIVKIEIYGQSSSFLAQNLEKMSFLGDQAI